MTKRSKSVVSDGYRRDYKADRFARQLSAAVRTDGKVDPERLAAIAKANGVTLPAGGNAGTRVMTLSVALRARKRHGEKVVLS